MRDVQIQTYRFLISFPRQIGKRGYGKKAGGERGNEGQADKEEFTEEEKRDRRE
jgi:hypothetical protein